MKIQKINYDYVSDFLRTVLYAISDFSYCKDSSGKICFYLLVQDVCHDIPGIRTGDSEILWNPWWRGERSMVQIPWSRWAPKGCRTCLGIFEFPYYVSIIMENHPANSGMDYTYELFFPGFLKHQPLFWVRGRWRGINCMWPHKKGVFWLRFIFPIPRDIHAHKKTNMMCTWKTVEALIYVLVLNLNWII